MAAAAALKKGAKRMSMSAASFKKLVNPLCQDFRFVWSRKWKPSEDFLLESCVDQHGPAWVLISSKMSGRNPQECRKHYYQSLLEKSFQEALNVPITSLPNAVRKRPLPREHFKNPTGDFYEDIFKKKIEDSKAINPLKFTPEKLMSMRQELVEKQAADRESQEKADGIELVRSRLFSFPDPLDNISVSQRRHFEALLAGYEPALVPEQNADNPFVDDKGDADGDGIETPVSSDVSHKEAKAPLQTQWMEFPLEDLKPFKNRDFQPVSRLSSALPRVSRAYLFKRFSHFWAPEEDEILREAWESYGYAKNIDDPWFLISKQLHRRTPEECRRRMHELAAPFNI